MFDQFYTWQPAPPIGALAAAEICRCHWVRSDTRTTELCSMPEKDLVCPDTWCVKCSMPKVPGCPTTSSHILQYASLHAFLAILTHNPLRR